MKIESVTYMVRETIGVDLCEELKKEGERLEKPDLEKVMEYLKLNENLRQEEL